jgi:hypothetical protein
MSRNNILKLLLQQVDYMFIVEQEDKQRIKVYFDETIERCSYCFKKNPNKYYSQAILDKYVGGVNCYHSVQYMTFLYYLANSIYRGQGANSTSDKLYYLNKMLNAVDLFYAVELPNFFMAEHPVGTVIGRAVFGEGFYFMQGCTVGGVERVGLPEIYPILGENVALYAGASIIGDCKVGNNVNIAAGALVKNQNIPDDVNVFGQSPNLIIKSKNNNLIM